jgi:hypothetical protein
MHERKHPKGYISVIDSIHTFLKTPCVAYLSHIDLQGYPHAIPVWLALDGDDLLFSASKSLARMSASSSV